MSLAPANPSFRDMSIGNTNSNPNSQEISQNSSAFSAIIACQNQVSTQTIIGEIQTLSGNNLVILSNN